MTLPTTYTVAEVAASLRVSEYYLRARIKDAVKAGELNPLRTSASPTARYLLTTDDVERLTTLLRPQPVPVKRRSRRRVA